MRGVEDQVARALALAYQADGSYAVWKSAMSLAFHGGSKQDESMQSGEKTNPSYV